MNDSFSTSVTIAAEASRVWAALTRPELMLQWMGEPEMNLAITTDWKIGAPISIRGFHHIKFENRGTVLQYETAKRLSYTHLSSVSRLPDRPESYAVLDFTLSSHNDQTLLGLTIKNFPTESIRKHLEFYWRTAVVRIRKLAEEG